MRITYYVVISLMILLVTVYSASTASNSHISTFTKTMAIEKAYKELGMIFPTQPTTVQGTVVEGGPTTHTIPATLKSDVRIANRDVYIVTFTEQWSAKDFSGEGASGNLLSHYWRFKVTPTDLSLESEGGDFPPQWVR